MQQTAEKDKYSLVKAFVYENSRMKSTYIVKQMHLILIRGVLKIRKRFLNLVLVPSTSLQRVPVWSEKIIEIGLLFMEIFVCKHIFNYLLFEAHLLVPSNASQPIKIKGFQIV